MRKDIGAGPAGGAAEGQGAILEIEAKLGQLVDKHRGERLRLPVLTECVISKDDPSIRTAFESSMSLVTSHPTFFLRVRTLSDTKPRLNIAY